MTFIFASLATLGCLLLWFIWRALAHIGEVLFQLYQVARLRQLQRDSAKREAR